MESFIDVKKIEDLIASKENASDAQIKDILNKALELKGLGLDEVAALINIKDNSLLDELFKTALKIKASIYGNRLVLFAPLYVSNHCSNNCLYCGFREE